MANEIISGTSRPVEPRRSKRGYCLFDEVTIKEDSGKERVIKKVCAAGDVAEAIRKGGKGKFFFSSFGGQTGVHGVHMADGTKAYKHYNNLEIMMLIGIAIGLFFVAVGIAGMDGFMVTPVVIGAVFLVAYFFMRSHRLAAKKQYDEAAA